MEFDEPIADIVKKTYNETKFKDTRNRKLV